MLAAQVVHAAGESSPGNLPEGTYAVVLAVAGAGELEELSKRLRLAGVRHHAIRESDPPYSGELMALGLEPARKSEIKRHLRQLQLLR